MNRRPRLLVTGFGPFPGIPRNPSAEAARRLACSLRWRRLGLEVELAELSTAYAALDSELRPALREHAPDALLMIGVAGRAREVRIETRARNRAGILRPDARKATPRRLVLDGGPAERRTRTVPEHHVAILRRHGFRVRASIDAGDYLCNASYFAALEGNMPVLFVHIPKPGRALPLPAGAKRRSSWQARLAAALEEVALDMVRQARAGRPHLGRA
jgi:pyroglutamyl-peptidase